MFTHTETEQLLLQAVTANPENDVPRAMLADELLANACRWDCTVCKGAKGWWADKGLREFVPCGTCDGLGWVSDTRTEFSEFIQCQLEGDKTPACPDCYDTGRAGPCGLTGYFIDCSRCPAEGRQARRKLWARAADTLERYGRYWFPNGSVHLRLATRVPRNTYHQRWLIVRRGFPEEVVGVSATEWRDLPGGPVTSPNPCHEIALPSPGLGRQILESHPTVTRVAVNDRPYQALPAAGAESWYWPGNTLTRLGHPAGLQLRFETETEARKAMSDYLIELARRPLK